MVFSLNVDATPDIPTEQVDGFFKSPATPDVAASEAKRHGTN